MGFKKLSFIQKILSYQCVQPLASAFQLPLGNSVIDSFRHHILDSKQDHNQSPQGMNHYLSSQVVTALIRKLNFPVFFEGLRLLFTQASIRPQRPVSTCQSCPSSSCPSFSNFIYRLLVKISNMGYLKKCIVEKETNLQQTVRLTH